MYEPRVYNERRGDNRGSYLDLTMNQENSRIHYLNTNIFNYHSESQYSILDAIYLQFSVRLTIIRAYNDFYNYNILTYS